MKICMFVYNNCLRDSRVLKEAATLAAKEHQVTIIALLDDTCCPVELRDGFRIVRVPKNPVHYRLFKAVRHFGLSRPIDLVWVKRIAGRVRFVLKPLSRIASRTARTWCPALAKMASFSRRIRINLNRRLQAGRRKINSWLAGGLKTLLMPFHRPLCFLDFYLRCLKLKEIRLAQAFHAHDLNTLPVAWLASRLWQGYLVYDSHELYTEISSLNRFSKQAYRLLERLLIGRADKVITVNQSIARILEQRYRIALPSVVMNCPESKGRVAGSTRFIRDKLGLDPRIPIILYQGGYSPNRGLENLVAAMGLVENGVLVFMGWGPLENKLRRLADGLALGTKVFFIEPVPPAQVLAWTSSADLGVIPFRKVGLNNYYATPNKLFEYSNAGVPVVASDFPEMAKIIRQFNLGRTFDPDNPARIAAAIEQVLADPASRAAMGRNALEAARRYNWEHEGCKLIKIYRELEEPDLA